MQGGFLAVLGMAGAVYSSLSSRLGNAALTEKRFRWFLVVIMTVALVYNEAWLNRPFALIFAYLSTWLVLQASEAREEVSEADEGAGDESPVTSDGEENALAGIPRLS